MKLKHFFAMLILISPSYAFSGQITNSGDASLNGATVIDFEAAAPSQYSSLSIDNVTFSTSNNEILYISSAYAGNYNTQGQSLQNTYSSDAFTLLNIDFSDSVSAFGFNYGASDVEWTLSAFNSNDILIDSMILPEVNASNNGEFFGLSGEGITSATLTASSAGDYIFIDNFTYTSVSAVPEPSTYALMLGGLGLVGFMAIRRRKQS